MAFFQGILHCRSSCVPAMSDQQQQADLDAIARIPRSRTLSATTEYADGSEDGDEQQDQDERVPQLSPMFGPGSPMPLQSHSMMADTALNVEPVMEESSERAKEPERPFHTPAAFTQPQCPSLLQDRAHIPAVCPYDIAYEAALATAAHLQDPMASAPGRSFSSIVPTVYAHSEPIRGDSSNKPRAPAALLEPPRRPRPVSPVSEHAADEHSRNEEADDLPPRKKHKGLQNEFESRPASAIASTAIIPVRLGRRNAKTFYVHKGQLTKTSGTFKYLLEEVSLESLFLAKPNPVAFGVYVDWLYTDFISCNAATEQEKKDAWILLANAYVLGSALKDQAFQDSVADTIRTQAQTEEPSGPIRSSAAAMISFLYKTLRKPMAIHTLMIDIVRHFDLEWLERNHEQLPKTFLVDLLLRSGGAETFYHEDYFSELMGERCSYHGHEEGKGEECYLKK